MKKHYRVDVQRCDDTGVLVATSRDIRGLTLEAETADDLIRELLVAGSELLRHNHGLSEDQLAQVTLELYLKADSPPEPRKSPRVLADERLLRTATA